MKQSTAGLLAALAALAPMPAVALECDYNSSIQADYWWHKESEETYVLVRGTFSDLRLIESTEADYSGDDIRTGQQVFSAKFEGFRPSLRAFDQPFRPR